MIKRGGIGNNRKENPHQVTIADDLGIISDANRFGETSTASADPLIAAWPARRAAIAGNRLADALHMRKHTLHAPKASPCRSEEHTSELQSLMRISYAVFCLKKKKQPQNHTYTRLNTKRL